MNSSAKVAGGVLLVFTSVVPSAMLTAQASVPVPAPVSSIVAGVVADSVAARWGVAVERVRLDWGRHAPPLAVKDDASVRLVGRGDDGWFAVVFTPDSGRSVASRLRAGVTDTVPVAAHAIGANVTLVADDAKPAEIVRWSAPGRRTAIVAGAGWITRRPLRENDPLVAPSVAPPALVHAGEPVHLEWTRGAVVVALDGTALGSATLGETVRVKLEGRPGQRSATVTGAGSARID